MRIDTPSAPTIPPPPHRPWFQFRLRSLMVFMVIISIVLGAFGWRLQRARQQAKAVAILRRLEAGVSYEAYVRFDDLWSYDPNRDSSIPAFIRQSLGDDFFDDADQVAIAEGQPTSAHDVEQAWQAIARLPK